MNKTEVNNLLADLQQFTGTAHYYRIDKRTLLTDGAYYLCEHAGAYWLMTLFSSHLIELKSDDWFAVLKLSVNGVAAIVRIEDGNDNLLATQEIEFTDFPLPSITLYGCLDGEQWVLMLPSEY